MKKNSVTKNNTPRNEVMTWKGSSHHRPFAWRRHQMETFSALQAICAGNSPGSGEIPAQKPVTQSFDVFFDLCLNKRLRRQSWVWWFETLSRPLWRHYNVWVKSTGHQGLVMQGNQGLFDIFIVRDQNHPLAKGSICRWFESWTPIAHISWFCCGSWHPGALV